MANRIIQFKNRNSSFRKHKVKANDTWIGIANMYTNDHGHIRRRRNESELPLNYEELAIWNGFMPGQDRPLHKGESVYLEYPYAINASIVRDDALKNPTEYSYENTSVGTERESRESLDALHAQLSQIPMVQGENGLMQYASPEDVARAKELMKQIKDTEELRAVSREAPKTPSGQALIRRAAAGVQRNQVSLSQLPTAIQEPVLTRIAADGDGRQKAASYFSTGIGFTISPYATAAGYLTNALGSKATDALSGRNNFSWRDSFDPATWTTLTSPEYALEHPNIELMLQTAPYLLPGAVGGAIKASGAIDARLPKSATIGEYIPETKTVRAHSSADVYHNPYRLGGYTDTRKFNGQLIPYESTFPTGNNIYVAPPIDTPPPTTPPSFGNYPFVISPSFHKYSYKPEPKQPNKSIFTQGSISRWQLPYYGTDIGPVTGSANINFRGYAPISPTGNRWDQEIWHNTSITHGGTPIPRYEGYSTEEATNNSPWIGWAGLGTGEPTIIWPYKNGGTLLKNKKK